jgi:1-aminocyclopropane-1-carboxylate deaminase/D-cysteine desulfhydrase-like pyridoxal-dependent ACC family enzyme
MKTKIWTDPIVDEVHKVREQIAQEAGNDLRKLVARLQESQRQHADRLVTRPPQRIGNT